MTNDQAISELNAKCDNLRPDQLAQLERQLKSFGLKFLAHIVHRHGLANCGRDAYTAYLADLDGDGNSLSYNIGNF